MTPLWERKHLRDPRAIKRAKNEGYKPYASSTDEEGRAITHLQRPAEPQPETAIEPATDSTS